jgi:hypothetical protein
MARRTARAIENFCFALFFNGWIDWMWPKRASCWGAFFPPPAHPATGLLLPPPATAGSDERCVWWPKAALHRCCVQRNRRCGSPWLPRPGTRMDPVTPLREDVGTAAIEEEEKMKLWRRQRLGAVLVLAVVFLYVGSGVMIQVLFDEMEYEKPFFFSYVSVGLCTTYLLESLGRTCRQRFMPPAHAYSKVLQPTQGGLPGSPLQLLRPALLLAPSYFCLNYTYFFSLDLTSVSSTMILSASTGAHQQRHAARTRPAITRHPHAATKHAHVPSELTVANPPRPTTTRCRRLDASLFSPATR